VGIVEDDEMITAAEKLKSDLERYIENFALEFEMNKWTVAGVLEEVKTDILFESETWPQPDFDEDDE
jgi:ribosomal protein S17E